MVIKKINFNYFKEIELLRSFAIIGVVVNHACDYFILSENLFIISFFSAVKGIALYGVPIFIIISGFLLSLNYPNNYKWTDFYKKRLKNIIPPYLFFSFGYYIFYAILKHENIFEITLEKLYIIVVKILTASASYHLWFFGLILQFYLFYPVINKIMNKYKNNFLTLLIISIAIQIIWIIGCEYIFDIINIFQNLGLFYVLIMRSLQYSFLSHIAYFIFGIYINNNYDRILRIFKIKRYNVSILILLILFTGILSYLWIFGSFNYGWFTQMPKEYYSLITILNIFYYTIITLFVLKLSLYIINKKFIFEKILIKFGLYSLGIFFIHVGIIVITIRALSMLNINYNNIIFYFITIISAIFISLIITYTISLFPYHEFLIGKIRHWEN